MKSIDDPDAVRDFGELCCMEEIRMRVNLSKKPATESVQLT